MNIVFREKFVKFNQIYEVELMQVYDVLIENNIFLDIGDDFCNDWAGFSYYYCKKDGKLDDYEISSFVYIITYFMTGEIIEINPEINGDFYFKTMNIIEECMIMYNSMVNDFESEIELCKELFDRIYSFYCNLPDKYLKKNIRFNFLLTYKEADLFDQISDGSRSNNLRILLNNYYNSMD